MEVPVALANKKGYVYAKVDPEDYEQVSGVEHKWRLSSSGYALYVTRIQGKFVTVYLHKVVYGGMCTHINGDRLDNRKQNLTESRRATRTKRTCSSNREGWGLARVERGLIVEWLPIKEDQIADFELA